MTTLKSYALGHGAAELARLDRQAALLAPYTRVILADAGLTAGMRVLDVGAGTGEVSLLAAELVGPSGSVLGVDRSPAAADYATSKAAGRGIGNVSFATADLDDYEPPGRFDAIVGRLVLPYLVDPLATVRRLVESLGPGGVYVAIEYDITGLRTSPATPLAGRINELITAGLEAAGAPQTLGPHLAGFLAAAGGHQVAIDGYQTYLAPSDPLGPYLMSGILRSLLPVVDGSGLAVAADLDIDTLPDRLADELVAHDAVLSPPTLVGASARF
jgi:SAM-dependent methyltransferase